MFFDPRTREGPGGLANECNCPMSEQPFLNRYERLDLPPIQYRPTRKKEQKRNFALKLDLLLTSSILAFLWPKELEGLD